MLKKLLPLIVLFPSFLFSQGNNISLVSRINYQELHQANLNDCWGYVDETGIEYALVGTTKGTSVVSLADPANPVEVFWLPGQESIWRDVDVWNNYAYVTTEATEGLTIINLNPLPLSPPVFESYFYGNDGHLFLSAHSLFIDSMGYMYVNGANWGQGGVLIFDLSDPVSPDFTAAIDMNYSHDSYVRENTLYSSHISDGFFSVHDVTDRSAPQLLNTQATPNTFTHNVWSTSDNHYAVTTDEIPGSFLTLYDVSDPENISEVDRIRSSPGTDVIPHNGFIVHDTLIISSYYTDGITIHNMSRPHNLVQIGGYDTHPLQNGTFNGTWSVYPFLPSGLLLASDITEGLFVLDPTIVSPAYFEGLVRDASDLSDLQGVTVEIAGDSQTDLTDDQGEFAVGTSVMGVRNVTFSKIAFYPQTISVNFSNTIVFDTIDLVPIPPIPLNVIVREEGTNDPVIDAFLLFGRPEMNVDGFTDGFGEDQVLLYYPGMTTVTAGKWGYVTECAEYDINTSTGTLTITLEKGIYDDFTFPFGWQVSVEAATSGWWERGVPQGNGFPGTTPEDALFDCGASAFVTGNGTYVNNDFDDLSNGRVTLFSPQFDLTGYTDPYIHYNRWFHCVDGPQIPDDTLEIFLSNGIVTVLVDRALPDEGQDFDRWISKSIHVTDFMPLTEDMQLTITVADEEERPNVTEAGFDFFFVANQNYAGIGEQEPDKLAVYPNPAQNSLRISGLGEADKQVRIITVDGKIIVETMAGNNTSVDCSGLPSGIYFIHVEGQLLRFIKD